MSGVFRNIDPPPPHRTASVYLRLWCGGRTHSLGGEGVGGPSSEDARHCSVLYLCKYFVVYSIGRGLNYVLLSSHGDHPQLPPACIGSPLRHREKKE
jgi:hypothetical protein